ncbi:MAG: hypothetical protein LBF24_03045 [Puniceicoccales bacterium]|jgi:hypothetical protein|nr:hypothetical protein [Puniceicoccales bacterium]
MPYPLRYRLAAGRRCPFNEKNSAPTKFSEKLSALWQTGKPLPEADGSPRIVFLVPPWPAEGALAQRIMELLAERGWECCQCGEDFAEPMEFVRPSIVLSMWPKFAPPAHIPAVQFWPNQFAPGSGPFRTASRYRYFLHGTPEVRRLAGHVTQSGRKVRSLPVLLSVRATDFCDTPKRRLFYSAGGWDHRRGTLYRTLYEELDRTGYLETYGNASLFKKTTPNSYCGTITDQKLFLERMKAAGVALVLHSDEHLNTGTNSSRLFEAAAASCVIISD